MPFSTTFIDIILALISLVSCVISVIMARISLANTREIEFYSRKDKLREIRNSIMELKKSEDYTDAYEDDLDRLTHDYLDEIDEICKRFSEKLILASDIKNDLIFIKGNPKYFGDLTLSPHLKKFLSKIV